jgi:succinylglutamic semialdehyde dehydrogenase
VALRFRDAVEDQQGDLATIIARETGKTLRDAKGEVAAVLGKLRISVEALHARTGEIASEGPALSTRLRHAPHGVMAVFGPYNFPCHLANGHIIPAILAGNTVVFKPSELTPLSAQRMLELWCSAGLPRGVINLVQGARATGEALAAHADINGILFTGSVTTGTALHRQLGGRPDIQLALEMGGNNPLVVGALQAAEVEAAAQIALQSAFLSSGQRCTCARRLLLVEGDNSEAFITRLKALTAAVRVGAWNDSPEAFMGPLVSAAAADRVLAQQQTLLELGAVPLQSAQRLARGAAYLRPGLLDVSAVESPPDDEIFGPLLQLRRCANLEQAIEFANDTRFGLSAGLLSIEAAQFRRFDRDIRAGIVNWNRPLTGASSALPFGGIGLSGNHRPSAFYAADYCAYPVASQLSKSLDDDPELVGRLDL